MKAKTLKRSLLLSILSLVLCVSMLLGTTFAWFTDSVTSANNIIASGNLDIELEYWDGEDWVDVAGKSNILTNELWEPGVTEVAYFRIANAGSLALKYQFGINIVSETEGVNVAGETFKLSDYIQFGVVENVNGETGKYADREAAVAAVAEAKKISAGYTKAASMLSGDVLYLALVVWMPTEVGNAANHNGTAPEIQLGINVFATQMAKEEDSFGPDYDAGAPWCSAADTAWYFDDPTATEFTVSSAEELAGLAAIVNGTATAPVTTYAATATTVQDTFAGKTVKLSSDIDLNNLPWTPIGVIGASSTDFTYSFKGTFDGQGHTISNLNVANEGWAGVFGIAHKATIKNLKVDGATISSSRMAAAIVGQLYGSIDNCHVANANIVAVPNAVASGYDNGDKVGGIVGWLGDNADNRTLTNCTVNGLTICGYRDIGGIAGYVAYSTTLENNKVTNATITGDQSVNFYGHKDYNVNVIWGRNSVGGVGVIDINNTYENVTVKTVDVADNTAAAQKALDNATPGTIIKLLPGVNYGTLYLRPVAGTAPTKEVDWIGNNYRYETYTLIENVTIIGAEGATVDAIEIEGGTYYNTEHSQSDLYPIMLSLVELKNVVIDGVTFTGKGGYDAQGYGNVINLAGNNIKVDGLTLKNCVLNDADNNARLIYKTEATNTVHTYAYGGETFTFSPTLKNITVTGCVLNGGYMGLELRETENVTITNNVFNVANRNILLPVNTGYTYTGTITITGNVSNNAKERFVRADGTGNAVVVIKDNTLVNYQGADADYIKVTNGNNVTIENNVTATEIYGLLLTLNEGSANGGTITVNNKEALLNLPKLSEDWADLFTDGEGDEYANYLDKHYYYYWNWSIVLAADIDFDGAQIQPIDLGKRVTFDGQGHTIKNAVIVTDATTKNNAGLFAARDCGVKNLKLDNINVIGSNVGDSCVGVLSGTCHKAIDNVTITNSSAYGGKYTGAVIGSGYTNITNCTIENVTVKGGYKLGGIIGYICAENVDGHNVTGNTLTNCTVDGIGDGIFAGGKTQYIVGKVVGNYNCNGDCTNNTITNMTTSATANVGKIEAGKTVTQ